MGTQQPEGGFFESRPLLVDCFVPRNDGMR